VKSSAAAALLLALMGLGGIVVILVKDQPPAQVVPAQMDALPSIETLCGQVAYGSAPKPPQTRGDTTILVMDLNDSLYTIAQANLYLTRALRISGCRHDSTVLRADGGLTFFAGYPDGRPLRLELKPIGSI
jgi:hypothetical protein